MPYRDFDNFDDAIAYVTENPERYVIKPSGTAANMKRRLFIGDEDDGQDVIRVLIRHSALPQKSACADRSLSRILAKQ